MRTLTEIANELRSYSHTPDGVIRLAAELERPAALPEDIRDFIRHVTLQLQKHRSLSDGQKDALFQSAYRLYTKYDVEGRS